MSFEQLNARESLSCKICLSKSLKVAKTRHFLTGISLTPSFYRGKTDDILRLARYEHLYLVMLPQNYFFFF